MLICIHIWSDFNFKLKGKCNEIYIFNPFSKKKSQHDSVNAWQSNHKSINKTPFFLHSFLFRHIAFCPLSTWNPFASDMRKMHQKSIPCFTFHGKKRKWKRITPHFLLLNNNNAPWVDFLYFFPHSIYYFFFFEKFDPVNPRNRGDNTVLKLLFMIKQFQWEIYCLILRKFMFYWKNWDFNNIYVLFFLQSPLYAKFESLIYSWSKRIFDIICHPKKKPPMLNIPIYFFEVKVT